MAMGDKNQHEWAWELHKQCDLLLHSRLSAYFVGQSFLVTSFVLAVANKCSFHPLVPPLISIVGFLTATMWLFVNAAMYRRLEALNQKYLLRPDAVNKSSAVKPVEDDDARKMREVFTFYNVESLQHGSKIIRFFLPIHIYKYFIPYFTPILFMTFWVSNVIIIYICYELF